MKKSIQIILACLFISTIASAKTYVAKKGETLASIARNFYGEPVFGPQGTLNKLLALNPKLKANPNSLEPGQEVTLDDKAPEKKSAATTAVAKKKKVIVDFESKKDVKIESQPITLPAPEVEKKEATVLPPPSVLPEPPQKLTPPIETKAETETPPPPVIAEPKLVPPQPVPAPVSAAEDEKSAATQNSSKPSRFFIAPSYSAIQIKATQLASGGTVDFSSSSVFGAKAGWDKNWNSQFSTILSGEYKAYKSDAISSVTKAPVIDSADLGHIDLALLNKVGQGSRMGLGLSYGQDIFISIDPNSAIATSFLMTELAPFIVGDFSLREMHNAELRGELRATYHSGEADTVHDTKKGVGVMAGISFERTFHKTVAWTLGLSFESNDQAKVGMTQKRNDANVNFGISF